MALVRPCLFVPVLCALACRPTAAGDSGGPGVSPGYTGPVVGALERPPATAPATGPSAAPTPATTAPEPVPAPEPPPTWEWALSVLPELAEHSEVDPSEAALARFVGWFDDGGAARVHVLVEGKCHAIDGTMSRDGFHGGWRKEITLEGDERRVSGMSFDIVRGGITESGPGGVIERRDEHGRWQEVGGFGTGYFSTLVDRPMSAADERSVTFGGYAYRLEPVCERTETVTQSCQDGSERRCERCAGVWLQPKAERMAWGKGRIGVGRVEPTPVDCTQPCPADEWTPRLPRLAAALAGRTFHGVLDGEPPVVFRSAKGCARELRRRKAEVESR